MTSSAAQAHEVANGVRTQAALFELEGRGKVVAVGNDRASFLHAVLTNNVKKLGEGMGCYATLLTREGRMISDLFLYSLKSRIILDVSPGRVDALLQGLNKYLITEDVALKDESGRLGMLTVQGPKAFEVLKAVDGKVLPEPQLSVLETSVKGKDAVLIRHGWSGEDGFDLIADAGHIADIKTVLLGAGQGLVEGGPESLELVRIEAGIPRFGRDMDEKTIPTEAGLEEAIDHDKGCYIGQEVIARIRDRGHVAKLLVRFEVEGNHVPERGAAILSEGRDVGRVTSSAASQRFKKVIGMGYIKWENRDTLDLEVHLGETAEKAKLKIIKK